MPATESENDQKKKHSLFRCRNAECGKTFFSRSNRDRHEKNLAILQHQEEMDFKSPSLVKN